MISLAKHIDYREFRHKKFVSKYDTKPWEILNNLSDYILQITAGNINSDPYIAEKNAYINNENIFIGKGTIIESGAYIKGPAYIGENVRIRSGAYIRENVIIGDNCKVGHASEIKNSILFDGLNASHFNYVGDSIVGKDVNLGAGVVCSNYKNLPYGSNISLYTFEGRIETGRNLFGAIIGDGCKIGCNSVLNPGSFLEESVITYSNINIRGYIEKNTIIKK
ncbi:hypothetical protein [Lysinibacillus halotolerans]|uniref:Mannose-1-phosphate guanyltransferase C-terminal domain-containing protein n=1 Tax=Lysinibacillus halotolerans TaxID=1368476 RepID=A0A3M8H497_9BACI|nr:hypothetical protein [Lysinibacillus halotolerans]RNC97251.1 hypothetical protein EC501_16275 [Lysinibacillus halotolerans]